MTVDVTLIPGDGIGPEITAQTVKVLEATGLRFRWDEELAGVAAVDATGTPLPDATVESICRWPPAFAPRATATSPSGWNALLPPVGQMKIGFGYFTPKSSTLVSSFDTSFSRRGRR